MLVPINCEVPGCCRYTLHSSKLCAEHAQARIFIESGNLTPITGTDTPKTGQSMADKYPKYYKPIPKGWGTMDTYGVNKLFPVDDPSGAILHARKKLLIPGSRTGGKSMRKDIMEARDTLNRWLEMNPE